MGKQRELSEEIINLISETAAKAAIREFEKQGKVREKERFDKRLNNTKMLLEHYRDFAEYEEHAVFKMARELDDELLNFVHLMEGRIPPGRSIESIESGVETTKIIMKHVNNMLKIYKDKCENSKYAEEARRYRVIFGLYLRNPKETVRVIAERENITERTVYKDIALACKQLTALIFGVYGFNR